MKQLTRREILSLGKDIGAGLAASSLLRLPAAIIVNRATCRRRVSSRRV